MKAILGIQKPIHHNVTYPERIGHNAAVYEKQCGNITVIAVSYKKPL